MKQAIGALYQGQNTCLFRVWGPFLDQISVEILTPEKRSVKLEKDDYGYWSKTIENVPPGSRYLYKLNNERLRPDPASRSQPDGVHLASEVIDPNAYQWHDQRWLGVPLKKMIIYELHPGTFTKTGGFKGIAEKLDYLLELGITAIELTPVAQFPGARNWGYDGVYPFAVQDSYGGVEGMKQLIDLCHQKGMGVILDVVYNHLGPEGNYMAEFGPYFTDKYNTPWGAALNFDDAQHDHVRNFFIQNALMWFHEFHIDALRLDAIHAIYDNSAHPFLQELSHEVLLLSEEDHRKYILMPESDLNDVNVLRPAKDGGLGMHAQWCDDFHHALHTLVTGEQDGYYADFGKLEDLRKSYEESFIYDWRYSKHRQKTFGSNARNFHPFQFVVFSQNHDQVGNRMLGERLSTLIPFEAQKMAAAAVLLSPYIPLLFMGEEYGEKRPFQYFISHGDADLVQAVRDGRKREFRAFGWEQDPPDPQSEKTFENCTLSFDLENEQNRTLFNFYKELIRLRKEHELMQLRERRNIRTQTSGEELLVLERFINEKSLMVLLNFSKQKTEWSGLEGAWKPVLDSAAAQWQGPGTSVGEQVKNEKLTLQPLSVLVLEKI